MRDRAVLVVGKAECVPLRSRVVRALSWSSVSPVSSRRYFMISKGPRITHSASKHRVINIFVYICVYVYIHSASKHRVMNISVYVYVCVCVGICVYVYIHGIAW